MYKIILLVVALMSFSGLAQEFEIPINRYPYSDIIEWKGKGALLLSKDPNSVAKQVNITLVTDEKKSVWDQKFTPKNEEYYYLASDNARYVYFLDNLEPVNGKVYFSQLNLAGNVKSTSTNIGTAIKKLGNYDYNKLELIDAVVTDKALVHHFRYYDKKEKGTREFATFTTHHNFLCYAIELGVVKDDLVKSGDNGFWQYIGFTGNEIYFAARERQNKASGWTVKAFTSKAKPLQGYFFKAPKDLISVENIGFGSTGKHYVKDKSDAEKGIMAQINGAFYLVGGKRKDAGASIVLYKMTEGNWEEINSINLNYFIEKKNLDLGIYPMNEGIGYHLNHNGYNKASILRFETSKAPDAHNDFRESMIYNPSSVLHKKNIEQFILDLPTCLIKFDRKQLGKQESVTFELKTKE